jgi:FolB domain-containing protein
MATPTKDIVFVRNVSIQAIVGADSWGRPKPQPALISVRVSFSIEKAGTTDNIDDCMDYRKIYKAITNLATQNFDNLADLARKVSGHVLEAVDGERIETKVLLPKGLLQSEGVSLETVWTRGSKEFPHIMQSDLSIHKLVIPCVIGIGAHERPVKQPVIIDLKIDWGLGTDTALFNLIFQVRVFRSARTKITLTRHNVDL